MVILRICFVSIRSFPFILLSIVVLHQLGIRAQLRSSFPHNLKKKFQQIVGHATTNKSKTTSVKAASHPRHKHLKIGNPTTPNRHHPTPTVNLAINNPPNRKVSTRSTVIRPCVVAKSHAESLSRQTPPPSATTDLHLHSPTSADREPRRAVTSCRPFILEPSHRRLKSSTWSLSYPDSGVFQTFNPIFKLLPILLS